MSDTPGSNSGYLSATTLSLRTLSIFMRSNNRSLQLAMSISNLVLAGQVHEVKCQIQLLCVEMVLVLGMVEEEKKLLHCFRLTILNCNWAFRILYTVLNKHCSEYWGLRDQKQLVAGVLFTFTDQFHVTRGIILEMFKVLENKLPLLGDTES